MIKKKRIYAIACGVVVLLTTAFLIQSAYFNTRNPESLFPDRHLENAIRKAIGKAKGEITSDDCVGIIELDIDGFYRDLEGIQYFVNLEVLASQDGYLQDISALKSLPNLRSLSLGRNKIEDISSLSALENLEFLSLFNNNITDVSPLVNLHNLKKLIIHKNDIKNRYLLYEIQSPELRLFY